MPDLHHVKAAVLRSLAFNKTVVLRYRISSRIPEAGARHDQSTARDRAPSPELEVDPCRRYDTQGAGWVATNLRHRPQQMSE